MDERSTSRRLAARSWLSAMSMRLRVRLALNQWGLAGEWTMSQQATTLNGADGRIVCRFHARDVHLVMGPLQAGTPVRFRVSIDGQPPGRAHGLDTDDGGNGTVTEQRLYQLIRQPHPIVDRTFESSSSMPVSKPSRSPSAEWLDDRRCSQKH